MPVFLEHLLLSVHSEWITFSGNSPSAECFHWCDEQLCWFQPWPLKKRKKIYPVVKLKRSKGYTYMFRILLVKICLGLKWRRNQDKVRDSLSPRGGRRGEALIEVWVGVCYWGLQTLTLFQTKTIHFAALFKTLLHCKHSPRGQGFWSRKTPCSLPWQPFLSCQAILIPNNGSYVICAPRYSWPILSVNIRPRGAQITQDPN